MRSNRAAASRCGWHRNRSCGGPGARGRLPWSALVALATVSELVKVTPTLDAIHCCRFRRPPPPRSQGSKSLRCGERAIRSRPVGSGVSVIDIDSAADVFIRFSSAPTATVSRGLTSIIGEFTPASTQSTSTKMVAEPRRSGEDAKGRDVLRRVSPNRGGQSSTTPEISSRASIGSIDENSNGVRDSVRRSERTSRVSVRRCSSSMTSMLTERSTSVSAWCGWGPEDQSHARFSDRHPKEFVRGVNLSQFSASPANSRRQRRRLGRLPEATQGFTRFHGLPPMPSCCSPTGREQDAVVVAGLGRQQKGAQIALWEMATWYYEPLDRWSDLEAACDSAQQRGCCNRRSRKSRRLEEAMVLMAPMGTSTTIFRIPRGISRAVGEI